MGHVVQLKDGHLVYEGLLSSKEIATIDEILNALKQEIPQIESDLEEAYGKSVLYKYNLGKFLGELLKKYPQATVTAIDYSDVSVKKAAEYNANEIKNGRCHVQRGDVSALALPEEKYDLATAFETIYFWPGLETCFSQIFKVLKPGGLFMIVNESDGTDEESLKFEKIIDGMKYEDF